MDVVQRKELIGFSDQPRLFFPKRRVLQDVEFRHCYVQGGILSNTTRPELRTHIQNVRIIDCKVSSCMVFSAMFENVVIDGLAEVSDVGSLPVTGAVFRNVILRGDIIKVGILNQMTGTAQTNRGFRRIEKANAEYYRDVDWALDITDAHFKGCSIVGVPADLIRRDTESQAVVKRRNLEDGRWRRIDFGETGWRTEIELFLQQLDDDLVLLAPKGAADFSPYRDVILRLRDARIAEQN